MAKYGTIQIMKQYKKRTIALCLASALTVVGAFGAENYSNTLMALKINVGSGGSVSMTAFTKKPLKSQMKQIQIDNNTFVLTLPDTDSLAENPEIDDYDNIEAISISTYPYTTESDGCTKIVVKTSGEPRLSANSALFIPDDIKSNIPNKRINNPIAIKNNKSEDSEDTENIEDTEYTEEETSSEKPSSTQDYNTSTGFTPPDYTKSNDSGGSFEKMTVLLSISIILVLIGIVYMFNRDKMASIVGDQGDLDVDGKKQNKKQSKTKKLRTTINKLDERYSYKTSADINYGKSYDYTEQQPENQDDKSVNEEANNVVDLDLLYQEIQKSNEENDDDDLAELLNAFSVEENPQEQIEEEPFDENLYNSVINNKSLNFSNSDIKKINLLLQSELSEDTLSDLNEYLKAPKKKHLTKQQILEDILSTYSIKQNIDFSQEDVDVIKKLMDVELGPDFAKDFTTNPARTKVVEKEIKESSGQNKHKSSEIITLKVKNMLPNLSEELKKHGGKSIKSEAKPDVVYYSEGYEYEKLHVSSELSDIASQIKGHNTKNNYQPSYQAPIVDSGYEVSTLAIKDELPDLADVRANPQKYAENKKTKQTVNEEALLKSISNVTFKPFYEDVENELNQFDNFEIIDRNNNENENFENYDFQQEIPDNQLNKRDDDNAKALLKLIETQQNERAQKKLTAEENAIFKELLEDSENKQSTKQETHALSSHTFDGKTYTLIKTIKPNSNSTCRLLKSEKECLVTGELNGKEYLLKQYDNVLNHTMQIRQNDKNDKTKFLVKIGINKFIISITEDNMEFVMDLC